MNRHNPDADMLALGELRFPDEAIEPILAPAVRSALLEWLTEVWARAELQAVHLEPRRKALFHGAPGVGKTTLAHHLAARLGLPLLVVRPESLIDRWLGATGRNIALAFQQVQNMDPPPVMFFDEFDALAVSRRTASQGAEDERNAYVNTLLHWVEMHSGFIIAATNRGADIDPAIWRRFELQIELDLPGQVERERILARYLAPYRLRRRELADLAEACATASPALMRGLAEALKRQLVIGPQVGWDMGKGAVFARVLAAAGPHPNLGKPRLWSLQGDDKAIAGLSWPLTTEAPPDNSGEDSADVPLAKGGFAVIDGTRR